MEFLILVAVLSTSLILLGSGAEHVAGQATLRARMGDHHVLGLRTVPVVAAALSATELLVAAGALWAVAAGNRAVLAAAVLLQAALYWSFAGYLARVVRAGNAGVPCGCGPAEIPVGRPAIARAIGLGALAGAAAAGIGALDPGSIAIRADADGLLAGVAGLTFAVLLVILAPARRLEPPRTLHDGIALGSPAGSESSPERTMIGSA